MLEEPPILTVNTRRNRPTEAQIAAFCGVPTGFVVDAMDGTGALCARIRPVGAGGDLDRAAAGPALTADNGPGDILATMAALRFIRPGDIVVAAFQGYQGCASAGDRLCGMMRNGGAAGFVTDGPMRDHAGIVAAGLPAWCTGLTPNSPVSKGPGWVGFPIQIGGRQVASGDMIVADRDGVVVVPFDRIDAVIDRLARVAELERAMDAEVARGLRTFAAVEALLDGDATRCID